MIALNLMQDVLRIHYGGTFILKRIDKIMQDK